MDFEKFWCLLKQGGTTVRGDTYHINEEGQLHIQSPQNINPNYRIERSQAERYFHLLAEVKMKEFQFKRGHPIVFYSVYEDIVSKDN